MKWFVCSPTSQSSSERTFNGFEKFRIRCKTFLSVFGLLAFASLASAANWYVDKDATGLNNGTSWINAWTNFQAIVWSSISPGDTIYVSGGKLYSESLSIGKSGVPGFPINIRVGRESGHNAPVRLVSANFGPHTWVTLNGSLNDSFVAPTNVVDLASRTWTSNIGFRFSGTNSGIYLTKPSGVQVTWVEIGPTYWGPGTASLWGNFTSGGKATNNVFRYIWLHDTATDGMQWIGSAEASGFENELAFSILEWVGDNAFEGANGWSIHDNIMGPSKWLIGHPDGIQSVGSYFKIYNNVFYDFGSSFLRLQAVSTNHHDILVFNNLFHSGKWGNDGPTGSNGVGELSNTGIEVVQYADGIGELPLMVWRNIVIANNTLYTTNSAMTGGAIIWAKRSETTPTAFVHNVLLTNCVYANNLFYIRNAQMQVSSGGGVGWQTWRTAAPWGGSVYYPSESSVVCDYNTHAGTYAGVRGIGFFGQSYPDGETMALSSIYKNNTKTVPTFVVEGQNFDLSASDTAARDKGMDLSAYFNFDILNRPRGAGGSWDRGAFEYSGTSTGTPPGAFSLATPADGTTGGTLTPTFTWGTSSGATAYTLEISSNITFPLPLVHSVTGPNSSYSMPAGILSEAATYYWRIRAGNSSGNTVAANAPYSFTTQAGSNPPGAFTLQSPANATTGISTAPILTWSDSLGETGYAVEIDSESNFATPLTHSINVAANTTSYAVPAGVLNAGSTYYWRIRATNAASTVLGTGSPRSFTTAGQLPDQSTNGMLLWLTFEDDFADNKLDDSSGKGNHAYRFGRTGSNYPTNFPTRILARTTPGANSNGYAGQFAWFTNDYGIYGRDGQYAAVTNVSQFTNLKEMTVAVWARFYSWRSNATGCSDYSCDQQATLMSAGMSTGIPGTWEFGRRDFNTLNKLRFQVMTNQSTFGRLEVHYPDPGLPNNVTGDTFAWAHYAFTWSNGVWNCYYQGTNFAGGNIGSVVTNLTVGWNNNVAMPFLGIGCITHGGSPALEDEPGGPDYPNHGWFNGVMDDVRIYNRALSPTEIGTIYSGAQPTVINPPWQLRVEPP